MVETARRRPAAIDLIERPSTRLRDISSRSAKLKASFERLRSGGRNPPVFISILKIEE